MMEKLDSSDLVAALLAGLMLGVVIVGIYGNSILNTGEHELKSQCELKLPRNQECTMVFVAPEKLSNDKTTTEVGHSIPK